MRIAPARTRNIAGPWGPFAIPAEPEATSLHAERCCRSVFAGEYSYARERPENVSSILDIGWNLGAFTAWACADWWKGQIAHVFAYEPHEAAFRIAFGNCTGHDAQPSLTPMRAAVTCEKEAFLHVDDNWGGATTHGRRSGEAVPVFHPTFLPPADVLKIDVEGCGHEIAQLYRYWDRVKVCAYETHNEDERDALAVTCAAYGLRMVRGNPDNPPNDVRVWVR